MKKCNNILLLIGLVLSGLASFLNAAMLINHSSAFINSGDMRYLFYSILYIVLLLCLVGVCPTLLLVKNLWGKSGKTLPVVTVVITALVMVVSLMSSLADPIPQYLIMSSIGLMDTYATLLFHYLENGGLCYLLGGGCVIAGCIVTFCENGKKEEDSL